MANQAPGRGAPGGVGAVRRPGQLFRNGRPSTSLVLAVVLSSAGAALGSSSALSLASSEEVRANRSDKVRYPLSPFWESAQVVAAPAVELTKPDPVSEAASPPPPPAVTELAAPPPAPDRPIVAPPSFPSSPARPSKPPKAITSRSGPRDGGVWAVMVGIDDYPGQDADLQAAAADAREVDSALAAYGVPASRRILLLNSTATAANITRALSWLTSRAAPGATAVFFYSGHVRQIYGDLDGDGEEVDEALVGADGNHVYDGEVASLLRSLQARSAWLGIAGCYAAGFDDALAPGRTLTAASGELDVAYENSGLGHSYLVEYMVHRAMLQGRASGSVQASFSWARSEIARDYPRRVPIMIDRSPAPVVLGRSSPSAGSQSQPPAGRPSSPPPSKAEESPPPAPQQQPQQPPPGKSDDCARLLSINFCSSNQFRLIISW
jgi:caspase domain-containing protein